MVSSFTGQVRCTTIVRHRWNTAISKLLAELPVLLRKNLGETSLKRRRDLRKRDAEHKRMKSCHGSAWTASLMLEIKIAEVLKTSSLCLSVLLIRWSSVGFAKPRCLENSTHDWLGTSEHPKILSHTWTYRRKNLSMAWAICAGGVIHKLIRSPRKHKAPSSVLAARKCISKRLKWI